MTRFIQVIACLLLLGCHAAEARATWQSTVQAAGLLAPGQVDNVEHALSALPDGVRDQALALLGKVTQEKPGLEGVQTAYATLVVGLPAISSGQPTKGTDPAQAAVLGAAQVWFQGFLVQSGQAVAAGPDPVGDTVQLLAAVEGMDLWTPGVRATLRAEARSGLGDGLYVQALQRAGGG